MNINKFVLTAGQTEILYNLEYLKTLNDISATKLLINNEEIKHRKQNWIDEWKEYISKGFSSFIQVEGAELIWYTEQELIREIEENEPQKIWFRLVLLEAMLFEPYYPLGIEKDKKGNNIPSEKYKVLQNIINGYKKSNGDEFIEYFFAGSYYQKGYIKRLRKSYDRILLKLKEVFKKVIKSLSVTGIIAIAVIATAGVFAPAIAVLLVGSNFAGLSGAALTSACLAYLGGGAIAIGGAGMVGGTMVIVGGGAILSIGTSLSVSAAVGTIGLLGKEDTIKQYAKLLVTVSEIFLNDEHDIEYAKSIYEQCVQSNIEIEKGIVELSVQADVANGKEKKELKSKVKNAKKSVEVMKIARNHLLKLISSFEVGLAHS